MDFMDQLYVPLKSARMNVIVTVGHTGIAFELTKKLTSENGTVSVFVADLSKRDEIETITITEVRGKPTDISSNTAFDKKYQGCGIFISEGKIPSEICNKLNRD